jgi:outer membrane protein insertion porin family
MRLALFAMWLAASSFARADLEIAVPRPETIRIAFEGNHALSSEELTRAMLGGFDLPAILDEEVRERGLLLIASSYYDHGYINVHVGDARLDYSIDRKRVTIRVPLREGEQFRMGALSVSGEPLRAPEDALAMLGITRGEIFHRGQLASGIMRISDELRNAGFAYAEVLPVTSVDSGNRTIAIDLQITRGPYTHVSSVRLYGLAGAREREARATLKVREGDPFNLVAIEESKRALAQLGGFRSIDVSTASVPGKPDGVELRFEVAEDR